MPVLKLGLKWIGVDVGVSRRPFTQYDGAGQAAIREDLLKLKEELAAFHIDFLEKL
jgi:hypothetical protein